MPQDPYNPFQSPKSPGTIPQLGNTNELASLGNRFLGALIDFCVMIPVIVIFTVLIVFGMISTEAANSWVFMIVSPVIGFGIFLLIHGYLLATKGQTVGKMVMKTQIVGNDGKLVPFVPLILKRYIPLSVVSQIPYLGPLVGLVNVLLIFRSNRKCLHDEIAGTKVIQL
jgi:uncharacterized RDD family membrane protein YckC